MHKVWKKWMRWKMPYCKCHTFWMPSWLIVILLSLEQSFLFYIERKGLFIRNLATILHLKSKLFGKFQRFNAINGSIEMQKNS